MPFMTRSEFAAAQHPARHDDTQYDGWRRELIACQRARQQPTWWEVARFVGLCALIVLVTAPIWLPALDQMFAFYGQ